MSTYQRYALHLKTFSANKQLDVFFAKAFNDRQPVSIGDLDGIHQDDDAFEYIGTVPEKERCDYSDVVDLLFTKLRSSCAVLESWSWAKVIEVDGIDVLAVEARSSTKSYVLKEIQNFLETIWGLLELADGDVLARVLSEDGFYETVLYYDKADNSIKEGEGEYYGHHYAIAHPYNFDSQYPHGTHLMKIADIREANAKRKADQQAEHDWNGGWG